MWRRVLSLPLASFDLLRSLSRRVFADRRQPPEGAVVVRFGGKGNWVGKGEQQARDSYEEAGRPVLSVFADGPRPGEGRRDVVARLCHEAKFGYRLIRVAFAADLRLLGYGFEPSEPAPYHYDVDISTVSEESVGRFYGAFAEEEENPTWPTYRRRKS